jgi:hypothetical protein
METLDTAVPGGAGPETIVFVDDSRQRFNLVAVFDSAFPDALALAVGEGWAGEIVPGEAPRPSNVRYTFQLVDGELVSVPSK